MGVRLDHQTKCDDDAGTPAYLSPDLVAIVRNAYDDTLDDDDDDDDEKYAVPREVKKKKNTKTNVYHSKKKICAPKTFQGSLQK